MNITKDNIGEILQRIYDSEIHLWIGWFWDAGLDYSFDPFAKPESFQHTGDTDLVTGFKWVIQDILEQYPKSSFSQWWLSQNQTESEVISTTNTKSRI